MQNSLNLLLKKYIWEKLSVVTESPHALLFRSNSFGMGYKKKNKFVWGLTKKKMKVDLADFLCPVSNIGLW